MQAPNAQGLMGLMSQGRAPQQPQQQMPSPQKASPMAGLGSVEDRVAAYRGNPAPLQQRYAASQDLLDLLALQKLKSEKENAARQMQLAMGQQQAAQGGGSETIAQQREKEVMELTKNELAQQRGETAQQQQEQQQGMMQKLMSGIARAPGAQAAAQPKAMAAGGIVGYAGGGAVAFSKGGDVDSARERIRAARQKLQSFGTLERRNNPEAYSAAQQEFEAAQSALQEAEGAYASEMSAAGVDRPAFSRRDVGAVKQAIQANAPAGPTARPAGPPVSAAYPDESMRGAAASLPGPAAPPAAPPRPAPTANPAAQAAAAANPAAQAAPAPTAAPAAAPAAGLPGLVDKTATDMMQRDPNAERKAMMDEIRQAYALTPEQRAVYEQGTSQRQKMFDETYNPERQRREGIKQFLLGAGGRRYGVLGGAAQTAAAYDEGQRVQKLKDFETLQKGKEGLVSLEREGIKPSIEGGIKGMEVAEAGKRSGLEAGFRRVEGQLDRESREAIARDNNRVQGLIAQAQRDGTMEARRQGFLNDINRMETRALEGLQKGPVGKAIANLEQIKAFNPKGFTKEQQAELDSQYTKMADAEKAVTLQMDVYREQVGSFGGRGSAKSGSGYKVTEITPGKK